MKLCETCIYFLRTGKPISAPSMHNLHQKGWDQAHHAGHMLRKIGFEHIFTSPIPYAVFTARQVARIHNGQPEVILEPTLINDPNLEIGAIMSNLNSLMTRIKKEYPKKRVLIVSHGRYADCFLATHLGKLPEHQRRLRTPLEHGEWSRRYL